MVAERFFDFNLEICTEPEDIDAYFENMGVRNCAERCQILHTYMGVTSTEQFGELTEDEEYYLAKEAFLSGRWKVLNGRKY